MLKRKLKLMEKKKLPRGIRNNNPLNIEHSRSKWQGMKDEQTDSRFVQFKSMTWGIRAAFKTLQSYRTKHKCYNLKQFIYRWCPPTEKGNDTKGYVEFVSRLSGISPDVWLPSPRSSESLWCSIVDSMIRVECGRPVAKETIHDAWHKAFDEI